MENRDFVSSWNSNFVDPKPYTKVNWTPTVPTKRKLPEDDPDNNCDSYECFEPPFKQFAIDKDNEVRPNIIKDGYIIDGVNIREGNFMNESRESRTEDVDMDDDEDSAEEREELGRGSVVLSNEVLESLRPGCRPTGSPILPQSIVDQMYKNAMALVVWEPPSDHLKLKSLEKIPKVLLNPNPDDDIIDDEDETDMIARSLEKRISISDSGGMDIEASSSSQFPP